MSKIAIHNIHIEESKKYALRIATITTSVIPSPWCKAQAKIFTQDLLNFGFHARASIEMAGLRSKDLEVSIDIYSAKFSSFPEGEREKNIVFALNRILHAREYTFGWAHADHRQIFDKHDNLVPTYVLVSTDKYEKNIVSLFGLAFVYLNEVVPLLSGVVLGE